MVQTTASKQLTRLTSCLGVKRVPLRGGEGRRVAGGLVQDGARFQVRRNLGEAWLDHANSIFGHHFP